MLLTNNRQQLPLGPQISFSEFMDKVNDNPFNFLMDLIQKYGDTIYIKLQQKDVYILSNPKICYGIVLLYYLFLLLFIIIIISSSSCISFFRYQIFYNAKEKQ